MNKDAVLKRINRMGAEVLDNARKGENPFVEVPIMSLSNVRFDKDAGMLLMGTDTSKRYFLNVAHSKKFMQTMLVAELCKRLLDGDDHVSLREAFYSLKRTIADSKENTFDEQKESDPVITDLELTLDVLREELHINADRRGVIAGSAVVSDRGDEIDLARLGSGGWAIPSNIEEIDFKSVDADFVLMVEKNATFDRLNQYKFWKKYNCILIGTQGQAARGARRLISRLHNEFKLPVYCFCDCDAFGFYIYSVIKQGSIQLAHLSKRVACPEAKYLGLTMSDIDKYGLKEFTIKAKDVDIKRAKELLAYPWFKHPAWQKEIDMMVKRKIKAEQEALCTRGLKFVAEEYLPEKLEKKDFLP